MIEENVELFKTNVKLGEGTYGEVYGTNNELYACKSINLNGEVPLNVIRELTSNSLLANSENIIKYVETKIIEDSDIIELYMPKYKSDLKNYIISNPGKIDNKTIKNIAFQILYGLYNASKKLIIHRDLKPENILVDTNNMDKLSTQLNPNIVICDWGCSRFMDSSYIESFSIEIQTLWYRAPEILLGNPNYDNKVDIWSAGIIICELFYGETMLKGYSEIDQLHKIFNIFGTPTSNTWPSVINFYEYDDTFPKYEPRSLEDIITNIDVSCLDLLNSMLTLNPEKRTSIVDALNNKYFDDIRGDKIIINPSLKDLISHNSFIIDTNYINNQNEINGKMREILFDWLIDVKNKLNLRHSTYFLGCYYIDIYLSKKQITKKKLVLVVVVCLYLSSKINEDYYPESDDYIYICSKNYTIDEFKKMEFEIFNTIRDHLYVLTEYNFLNLYTKEFEILDYLKDIRRLLYYLSLDISSRNYKVENLVLGSIIYYIPSLIINYNLIGVTEIDILNAKDYIRQILENGEFDNFKKYIH